MIAPVIGITAYQSQARWGAWDGPAVLIPANYASKVSAAGGIPVVLAPIPGTAKALVARLDGLVLSGGPDIDPPRYGQARHPQTEPGDSDRDAFELEILESALQRGIPVLAICRGAQLLNVARGGTLHQHLPDVVGNEQHSPSPGTYGHGLVTVEADSKLAGWLGATSVEAACHHHQAIDRLGECLRPVAFAPDGTVEGVEDPSQQLLLGVQWHPEVGDDPSLFSALVTSSERVAAF